MECSSCIIAAHTWMEQAFGFPFSPLHSLFTVKQVHFFLFFLWFFFFYFFRVLRLLTEPQHSCVPQVEIRP